MDLIPDRSIRLAVTGLSGAGKTVFMTALIDQLLRAGEGRAALPFFTASAHGDLKAAKLRPSAHLARKQFPYAEHLAVLTGPERLWPAGTDDVSEALVALRYRPTGLIGRQLADAATLNIELIDYPGEWLLDLPLLDHSFESWSRATLALAGLPPRPELSAEWRALLATLPPTGPADEATARHAASTYTAYLRRCRERRHGLSLVQPGRFLLPGEYHDTPALWFCPLDLTAEAKAQPDTLHALMRDRFEAYKREIVQGFYRRHFRRFDRQVVLVDVLRALDSGQAAFEDAGRALAAILHSFRFGRAGLLSTLLAPLLGSRIDKVLFVATKADHVTPNQYGNLRMLLSRMLSPSATDITFAGGQVETRVAAALRCTELGRGELGKNGLAAGSANSPGSANGPRTANGQRVDLLRGTLVGETTPRTLYPGEVPAAPPSAAAWQAEPDLSPEFRPPPHDPAKPTGMPHIGLDEVLQSLLGDKFL
ncbi:MAG TPA: YcjX family protein [Stellaceae bacterium]|nr:YcjX family protein [Stellaceae bacterium]